MIDTHCHLDFDAFDDCREEAIKEAEAAGVHTIINIGVDIEASRRCVQLAEQHHGLYASVGIHPHDARTFNDKIADELRRLADHPRVVAIGEIGLDFYRDLSPRPVQRRVFTQQLKLAVDVDLPVVIHTRDSFSETMTIVREYAGELAGGVFHCFPGDVDDALEVIDLGLIVSFGGVITFQKAHMAQVAAQVPLDKMILETDAPYLAPVPYRGKKNRPEYVKYVYRHVAKLRDIDVAQVEKVVDRTAQKLFGLVETCGG
ncbi:MAG: TatD family hydrolase [bacterium]